LEINSVAAAFLLLANPVFPLSVPSGEAAEVIRINDRPSAFFIAVSKSCIPAFDSSDFRMSVFDITYCIAPVVSFEVPIP
jgi:hypothetical protein